MELNSPKQLERARRVLAQFGHDWSRMIASAEYRDGVYHVRAPAPAAQPARTGTARQAR